MTVNAHFDGKAIIPDERLPSLAVSLTAPGARIPVAFHLEESIDFSESPRVTQTILK